MLAHHLPSTLVLASFLTPAPESLPGGWCTWRGASRTASVALTFDDGPDPAGTLPILGLLDDLGMAASFFLLGERVEAAPELAREIAGRGHTVGVHGYRHVHHLAHGPLFAGHDLDAALSALGRAGIVPRFFRPPYGQASASSLLAARRRGLRIVLWSAWGREFADTDEDQILSRLAPRLVPGAVVLLHDADGSAPAGTAARSARLLPRLAKMLAEKGLSAVTLDELLGHEPETARP